MKKIAVLGCGNMARAIVLSMYKENSTIEFHTYTPSYTKALNLSKMVNGKVVKDPKGFDSDIDAWIIACKPQQFEKLVEDFANILKNKLVISIMAAIKTDHICKKLETQKVIRFMPSMPSEIHKGTNLIFAPNKDLVNYDELIKLLQSCGTLTECKSDKMLNELTIISASGPGFLYYFMNLFYKQAMQMGLDDQASKQMINSLFIGSAELMKVKKESFSQMQDQVTSKGGVTIAAIEKFNEASIPESFENAINTALKRSEEVENFTSK